MVVPPMLSNTPWLPSKTIKRAHYRSFPNDLRPSIVAGGVAHVLGTVVEVVTPLVLLFTTNGTITLLAVALMVAFHLFILSTFPLAVPLEWNLLFAYAAVFLFLGFPNAAGFGLGDVSSPLLLAAIVAALVFFPILGNLRPDLVSFLPRCGSTQETGPRRPGRSPRVRRTNSTSSSSGPVRTPAPSCWRPIRPRWPTS